MFRAHSNLTNNTLMSNLAILAGLYRGRVISSNIKEKVRPTSSKLRKSLFDILGDLSGSCVLDLFAGTGSVGFEAASRGASSVMFIEKNRRLSNSILKNKKPLENKKAFKGLIWCGREDSNFHGVSPTATSTLRVYHFRHDRMWSSLLVGNSKSRDASQA